VLVVVTMVLVVELVVELVVVVEVDVVDEDVVVGVVIVVVVEFGSQSSAGSSAAVVSVPSVAVPSVGSGTLGEGVAVVLVLVLVEVSGGRVGHGASGDPDVSDDWSARAIAALGPRPAMAMPRATSTARNQSTHGWGSLRGAGRTGTGTDRSYDLRLKYSREHR